MMNCICERFLDIAKKCKERYAVIDKNRRLTYGELKDEALRWAGWIRRANENNGAALVGIMTGHCTEQISAIMGVLFAGYGYIPMEPDFPFKRVRSMLQDANVKTIITERQYKPRFDQDINTLCIEDFSQDEEKADLQNIGDAQQNIAYVLYTSGSTGTPKGVIVSYQNVLHYANAFQEEFNLMPEDRVLQMSVVNFDIFVEEVFPALLNGSGVCILDTKIKDDIKAVVEFCENNKVTVISSFPYFLQRLNSLKLFPKTARVMISGGDTLYAPYIDWLIQYIDIYNTYGPTETTVCATYYKCKKGSSIIQRNIPVGFPIKNVRIKLTDEQGRPVKPGAAGEICISGDGVSSGYLNRPGETERSFIRDKISGELMYLSGDMGYIGKNGELFFLHRKDNQLMIQGKRVECMEVENVINQSSLTEYAVVNPSYDKNGFPHIVAHLKLKKGSSVDDVRRYIVEYLLPYMLPEYYILYDTFPMGSNGKINRSALDFKITD